MGETIAIAKGMALEVACGPLSFRVLRREIGADGGVSIELYESNLEDARELLRFDLFRDDPHYHVPASEPMPTAIETKSPADSLEFALACIREQLPALLERAGFPTLANTAATVDRSLVAKAVASACSKAPEPEKTVHYPLTPEVRRRVGLPPA